MKITGIVVEYNPFHNGHLYHIQKSRELTDCDLLIAVCSGNFSQRGDISVIDKFTKAQAALDNGVDLIVELPYVYTTQNASIFAQKAIDILNELHCDHLVFGSETNNLAELKKYAELNINVDHLKELMDSGMSYPQAYGLLSAALYPNDILAVSYLKALKNYPIIPLSIQRTNSYNSPDLTTIASAGAIRKALKENKDISLSTPLKIEHPVLTDDLYPYLQRLLFTKSTDELQKIHLVSEGIEHLLKEKAYQYNDYRSFITSLTSRRYTSARIQRICLQIMLNITSEEVRKLPLIPYVRILGFNEKGRSYLHQLKKEDVRIITQFKKLPEPFKRIEWKATSLYATYQKNPLETLKRELKGPIISKL